MILRIINSLAFSELPLSVVNLLHTAALRRYPTSSDCPQDGFESVSPAVDTFCRDHRAASSTWKLHTPPNEAPFLVISCNTTQYRVKLNRDGENVIGSLSHPQLDEIASTASRIVGIVRSTPAYSEGFRHLVATPRSVVVDGTPQIDPEQAVLREADKLFQLISRSHPPVKNPVPASAASYLTQHGPYYFKDALQIESIKKHGGVIKSSGALINPCNWPTQIKSVIAGHPEKSTTLKHVFEPDSSGFVFVLDGADDMVSAAQGSGMPQQLWAALQATLLYPLFLPIINVGYVGACDEAREAGESYQEASAKAQALQKALVQSLINELAAKQRVIQAADDFEQGNGESADLARDLHALFTEHRSRVNLDESSHSQNTATSSTIDSTALLDLMPKDSEFFVRMQKSLSQLNTQGCDNAALSVLVRLLADYKTAVDEAFAAKFKSLASARLAMLGTGTMWWGIAFYEAAAIAKVFSASNASQVLTAAANQLLPVGQAAMAIYGLCNTFEGARHDYSLAEQQDLVRRSPLLDGQHEMIRRVLSAKLSNERTLNIAGKIVAGPLLTAGQVAMLLGGPVIGLGTPVLVAGAVATGAAIALRATCDITQERRSGYDPASFDAPMLVDIATCPADKDLYQSAVDKLCDMRLLPQEQLVWIKLLKHLEMLCATHPDHSPHTNLAALLEHAPKFYTRPDQAELRTKLEAVLYCPENQRYLREYLELDPLDRLLALGQKMDSVAKQETIPHSGSTTALPDASKFRQLHDIIQALGLSEELRRKLLKRMLVTEPATDYRASGCYEPYLRKEVIFKQSTLRIPLLAKEIPTRKKQKTAYIFRLNKFLRDTENTQADPILQHLKTSFIEVARQVLFKQWKYQIRSKVLAANAAILSCIDYQNLRETVTGVPHVQE